MTLTVATSTGWDPAPFVQLSVASTLGGSEWVSLWRTHADGSRYRVLVDRNARLTGGSLVGLDRHCPFGQVVTYSAGTASETSAGVAAVLLSDTPWLIHASETALSMPVEYVPDDGFGDDDYASTAGVFEIVGGNRPAVVWDDTVTVTSSVRLGFLAEDARQRAAALLRSGGPLLLNMPSGWDVDWRWVQGKSVKFERNAGVTAAGGKAGYPYRYLSCSYTWVDTPDVDLTPQWTYDDLPGAFATLNALEAAYATLDDLILDNRIP